MDVAFLFLFFLPSVCLPFADAPVFSAMFNILSSVTSKSSVEKSDSERKSDSSVFKCSRFLNPVLLPDCLCWSSTCKHNNNASVRNDLTRQTPKMSRDSCRDTQYLKKDKDSQPSPSFLLVYFFHAKAAFCSSQSCMRQLFLRKQDLGIRSPVSGICPDERLCRVSALCSVHTAVSTKQHTDCK